MFLSWPQFAICKSSYSNINLKVKQVKCLEVIYFGRDGVAVLPTGYGKSLIFQLFPSLLHARTTSTCNIVKTFPVCPIIIVVSPLNAVIKDQQPRSQSLSSSLPLERERKGRGEALGTRLADSVLFLFLLINPTILNFDSAEYCAC